MISANLRSELRSSVSWEIIRGNMSSRIAGGITTNYIYDIENRLTEVKKSGSTIARYEYDGDGGRTKKTVIGTQTTVTKFIGSLYEETGSQNIKYVFLGDTRVNSVDNTEKYRFYHADHLGGTNVISNGTGTKIELIEYDPYSQFSRNERYDSSQETAWFYFTGKKLDNETRLFYYGARYYDPKLGRFITADTIVQDPTDPQTLNRYSYTSNNPVNRIDPDGHSWFKKFIGKIVGGVLGIVTTIFTGGNVGLGLSVFNFLDSTITVTQATGNFGLALGYSVGASFAGHIVGGFTDLIFTETLGNFISNQTVSSFTSEFLGSAIPVRRTKLSVKIFECRIRIDERLLVDCWNLIL